MTAGTDDRGWWRQLRGVCALAVRAAPGHLALYSLITLVTGLVPVVSVWLTKSVLDGVTSHAPVGHLVWLAVALAVIGATAGVAPMVTRYLRGELERRVALSAQDQLFVAVEGFVGLERFENPAFADRLRLAQTAGRTTAQQVLDAGLGMTRSVFTVAGFIGSLAVLSPVMTVAVIAAGAPILVSEFLLSRRKARMLWELEPTARREFFYSELLSGATAAKEVRLFGISAFLRNRMLEQRHATNAATRANERREVGIQGGLALLAALVSGAGLVWAVVAARVDTLSVGDITVFVAASVGVQGALAMLAKDAGAVQQTLLMFDHFLAVTDAGPDLPTPPTVRPLAPLRSGIEFRGVWFRYSDQHDWVLRGVDLWIPRGRSLALVGLNGAGKSTLVKLLCRFYDPSRGSILWDGVDIREIDPAELRRRIGAVFQDYMHYDLLAAENIALGDLDALHDRPRLRAAAEEAGIHRKLATLPYGYDTMLSRVFTVGSDKDDPTTGVVLSGGEQQRLALARALLRDRCDLMILDEPAAGLDAQAEAEIHQSLRRRRENRTSLLISHRLAAVRDADHIVVLSGGIVVERGDHSALIAENGLYAQLFGMQASGYQAEPVGGA
ncbi:ABC transporter ATP-binding protein [Fodinicola acaciae]|uniref:ABC transporter ATP-binding protein n=1 Tax=Fodinicola acaciae TaxID=2681555 RepID=UPI0013D718E0|nr:ABC transporter ATP-binding protein [Fodinicola acaciae]